MKKLSVFGKHQLMKNLCFLLMGFILSLAAHADQFVIGSNMNIENPTYPGTQIKLDRRNSALSICKTQGFEDAVEGSVQDNKMAHSMLSRAVLALNDSGMPISENFRFYYVGEVRCLNYVGKPNLPKVTVRNLEDEDIELYRGSSEDGICKYKGHRSAVRGSLRSKPINGGQSLVIEISPEGKESRSRYEYYRATEIHCIDRAQ